MTFSDADVMETIRGTRAAKTEERLARLVEDITWLAGTDTPRNIAARLGYRSPESLGRHLAEHGHPQLGRLFTSVLTVDTHATLENA